MSREDCVILGGKNFGAFPGKKKADGSPPRWTLLREERQLKKKAQAVPPWEVVLGDWRRGSGANLEEREE